jgi:hypothetical protein
MRSKRTGKSQRLTLVRDGDGEGESGRASSTLWTNESRFDHLAKNHQGLSSLSESLNSLEREVQTLESRFYEVCVTLNIVMGVLVERKLIGINTEITKEEE